MRAVPLAAGPGLARSLRARRVNGRFIAASLLVPSMVALSSCAYSGPLSSQVSAWASTTGFAGSTSTIGKYVSQVSADERSGKTGQAQLACAGVAETAGGAENELPAPDRRLTTELDAAYSKYYDFGVLCEKGKGHINASLAATLSKAKSNFAVALRRYHAIVGGSSGSTTTAPSGG